MTDKEKVIQLLLDNGFEYISVDLYVSKDIGIYLRNSFDYNIHLLKDEMVDYVDSYLELVGFLYLKYGKVNITK